MTTAIVAIIFGFAAWILGEARGYRRGVKDESRRQYTLDGELRKLRSQEKINEEAKQYGTCLPHAE